MMLFQNSVNLIMKMMAQQTVWIVFCQHIQLQSNMSSHPQTASQEHQKLKKTQYQSARNVLKNKANNQPFTDIKSSGESDHIVNKNHRSSTDSKEVEENKLLLQKKGLRASVERAGSNLRNIIKQQEEEYKQSKPFNKKYGSHQNTTVKTNGAVTPQLRSQKLSEEKKKQPAVENKNKTKQSFNKKLSNNIIKDEEGGSPNLQQAYRIKKVDNRSPKKLRDDIISLNEVEQRLQKQIFEQHKKHKHDFEKLKQNYEISINTHKLHHYIGSSKNEKGQDINLLADEHEQLFLNKLQQKLKAKRKELSKIQHKIQQNGYIQYIVNLPKDIEEMNSSEQEDTIVDLPVNQIEQPRLDGNSGSYSIAMKGLKDKKNALNLRRTYDVFKTDESSRVFVDEVKQAKEQQKIKQDGDNKLTINNRLKDFLLS